MKTMKLRESDFNGGEDNSAIKTISQSMIRSNVSSGLELLVIVATSDAQTKSKQVKELTSFRDVNDAQTKSEKDDQPQPNKTNEIDLIEFQYDLNKQLEELIESIKRTEGSRYLLAKHAINSAFNRDDKYSHEINTQVDRISDQPSPPKQAQSAKQYSNVYNPNTPYSNIIQQAHDNTLRKAEFDHEKKDDLNEYEQSSLQKRKYSDDSGQCGKVSRKRVQLPPISFLDILIV